MGSYPKIQETEMLEKDLVNVGLSFRTLRSTTVLGASSWMDLQLNPTSTSTELHISGIYINHGPGLCQFEVMEANGSTVTTGTSSRTVYNKNRNSTITSNTEIYGDPSNIGDTNVRILTRWTGSTGLDIVSGRNLLEEEDKLILKVDSTYIFRLYDLTATAGHSFFELLWDER